MMMFCFFLFTLLAVAHPSKQSVDYDSREGKSNRNLLGNSNFQDYPYGGTLWQGDLGAKAGHFPPSTVEQCASGPSQTLNTTAFFNFKGRPENLTADDVVALTEAFLSAYDDLGASRCFEVLDVTIDMTEDVPEERMLTVEHGARDSDRNLADTTGDTTPSFSFNFSLFFFIIFQCNFCPTGISLLTNDASRRLRRRRELLQKVRRDFAEASGQNYNPFPQQQQQQQQYQQQHQQQQYQQQQYQQQQYQQQQYQQQQQQYQIQFQQQYQQQQQEFPQFPQFPQFQLPQHHQQQQVKVQPQQCSADRLENCVGPTRDIFAKRYNEMFQSMRYEGQAVDEVVSGCEITIKPCDPIVTEIDTHLEVILQGDYYNEVIEGKNNNTYDETRVIEMALKTSYNGLNMPNPETCDLQFRHISSVQLVEATRLTNDTFSMSFNVTYGCRGCESSGGLFSIIAGASNDLERENVIVDCREEGPVGPLCSCANGVEFYRAPTSREFTRALRHTMQVRNEQCKLHDLTPIDSNDATTETIL